MGSKGTLLVPEGTRLLHIGPHKTGSTAIQVALHESRAALAAKGVHHAGNGVRPDLAGWSLGLTGRPSGSAIPPERHWLRLVDEVAAVRSGRVVISNEDFGRAGPEHRERIVRDLGGDQVHVVAAARRLDSFLPSQWQERVKAGDSRSYEEWLRIILDRSTGEYSWDRMNVWRAHDTAALVEAWVELVGEDRFTLVVLDEADRLLLPSTFEELLGLSPGSLAPLPDRSNRSLTWAEAELVRALNQRSKRDKWPADLHNAFVRRSVSDSIRLRPSTTTGVRTPPLPAWALEKVVGISARRVEAIGKMGIRVVGDPAHLYVPEGTAVADPDLPTPELDLETVELAVSAVIAKAMARLDRQAAKLSGQQPDAPARPALGLVPDSVRRRVKKLIRRG